MNLDEYINITNQATNTDELFSIFMHKLEQLGFDRLVYSFMTDSPLLSKKAEHGVIRNYPEDWMKYYGEQNYTEYDPAYRTALVLRRPFSWKEVIEKQKLTFKQKKVMFEASEAGLKDGVCLAIHGPMGETVGFGFASSVGNIDTSKDILSKVYLLAHQFHLCYAELVGEDRPITSHIEPILSARERDVLLWCAKNKSNTTIADFLGISPKTVDFHLANIFKKLGVNSRMLAVLKAFHLGLISI